MGLITFLKNFILNSSETTVPQEHRIYIGSWKVTTVDMAFAEGKIPPEKMDEAMRDILENDTPAFVLNLDGNASIVRRRTKYRGSWSVENEEISIECPGNYLRLERIGDKLATLPDRTFTFERQA